MTDTVATTLADSLKLGLSQRTVSQRIQADYIVMVVAMVVWVAMFFYLMRLDRRSKELQKS